MTAAPREAGAVEALLSCPFCGSGRVRVIGGPGTRGGPQHWAGCDLCHGRAWGDTEAEAIAAWNTRAALAAGLGGWVSVEDRLPGEGCYLAVIERPGGHRFVSLVCFGGYDYYTEHENPKLAPGESLDPDEGHVSGKGWHNEEDSHGGEYDTYVVTYFDGCSRGRVTHWQPRPPLPSAPSSAGVA